MKEKHHLVQDHARLARLREKHSWLLQAVRDSEDVESKLRIKRRMEEAEIQKTQTVSLKQKQADLQAEIDELEHES